MIWPLRKLSELGEIVTGATPRTSDESNFGGGMPFVTPTDLGRSEAITTSPRTLTKSGASSVRVVPAETVLVCCIGSLGKVGFAGRALATNQQINAVIFDPALIFPRFGFYACALLKSSLEAMAPATTIAIVSKSKFSNLEIPVPPLSEQRRIAAALDQANALRRMQSHLIGKVAALRSSNFTKLFGEMRRGSKDWPLKPFGEIVSETKLGLVRSAKEMGDNYPYPYIRMDALASNGSLDLADLRRIEATESEVASHHMIKGDFLFNTRNSKDLVGKTALFDTEGLFLFNNNLMRIRFSKEIASRFAAAAFLRPLVKAEVDSRKSGTTSVFAIYWKNLSTVMFPVPPLSLQHKFAQSDEKIARFQLKQNLRLKELDRLFVSLQQSFFSADPSLPAISEGPSVLSAAAE